MKKLAFLIAAFAFLFASCSQIGTDTNATSASINLRGKSVLTRTVTEGYSSDSIYTLEFKLTGDKQEEIVKSGSVSELQEEEFYFKEIPVGSKVKVLCSIVYHDGSANGTVIWTGESEELTITAGENYLSLLMKKCFEELGAFDHNKFTELEPDWQSITKYTIPYGYTSVGSDAYSTVFFSIFTQSPDPEPVCEEIIIPDSVIEINQNAFSSCSWIKKIKMSQNIHSIGQGAFSGCTGLTSIEIPKGTKIIYEAAFNNCSGLTSITIPSSV